MNFTLHQLQVFLKVSETKSITKAAEELYLTQPAVSIQLKNFQDQFDIPLTEVVGRQLYVTDFGQEIAFAAQAIVDQVNAINYKLAAYKGQLSGRLKIASVSTGKYVIPYFLSGFIQENPQVELKLDVTNKVQVLNSLTENEIDFALVSILPDKLPIQAVPLMENKLYLVSGKRFASEADSLGMDVFQQLTLIYREQGSGTRITMEDFLNRMKIPVKKTLVLTSNEAVKQAVIAGLGCSIMPMIGIKNELKQGDLRIIQVDGLPIQTYWNLIYLKSKRLSPAAEAFLAYLEREKEHIIQQNF
ncbi:MAG: LysR family transcriptional regulator [Lunatimonas sp.]|uniref:LysR family transcriptional regulator n=1 Tax=Lunatimonas sp. TaxID=2060141 RepID=UPI00263AE892|nr:LysR family transcriptional regulator [Lunatimonas sp.]MCC5937903.1 LysR family transcriptional regulator [Lunatimonas sp.]